MTTKLKVYNGALRVLGETPLATLEENRKPRRLLDGEWDDGFVKGCLEQGQWNFALRTSKLTYTSSVETSFGYSRVFEKPVDWVNTTKLCSDERLQTPILDYRDEGGYWYADDNDLYIQYVSDDAAFGSDLSLWPESFSRYVRFNLAMAICIDLTQSETRYDKLEKQVPKILAAARSKDAMNQATQFLPEGRWSRARRGGRRADRTGSRLIG